MNLGEFIIRISTKGDTKEIETARKRLEATEKAYRRNIKMQKELAKATTEDEKAQIKASYARQEQIEKLKEAESAQKAMVSSTVSAIRTGLLMITTISGMVIALDRLGNSLLKNNQLYITFNRQTGMSISNLNRMTGVARLSGMNLSPEQVMSDLQNLQQKIFKLPFTGEGLGAFTKAGINPMGMTADQFMIALRQRLKGNSPMEKSYILSEIGLSQEWLNVLDLADKDFNHFVALSSKLQLTEEQRAQLAKYTLLQQENNMRFEYAKQKLLLAAMPLIQEIMEAVSKIALKISDIFEKHPVWLRAIRDILLILTGSTFLRVLSNIGKLLGFGLFGGALKGIGRVFGKLGAGAALKFAGKQLAKKGILAATGWAGGPVVGVITSILSIIWLLYDLIKPFFEKDKEKDKDEPEPVDLSAGGHFYKNTNANITNHFHNNPQPVSELERSLYSLAAGYQASVVR